MQQIRVDSSIFTNNNPYGYRIQINHPAINRLWRNYKNNNNIPRNDPPSDEQRHRFEAIIFKMIKSNAIVIDDN